jgi:hypothetical protein
VTGVQTCALPIYLEFAPMLDWKVQTIDEYNAEAATK